MLDPRFQRTPCVATRKDGAPCKSWAIHGATVCRMHGGATRHVKAKAAARVAERTMTRTLGRLTIVPVANPLEALAQLAGEVLAWKELCAGYVAHLEELRYDGDRSGEQIRGEIQLFERALDRCASTLGMIARLNIDERLVKIEQEQLELVERAIIAALDDASVEPDRQREVVRSLGRHLRSIAS